MTRARAAQGLDFAREGDTFSAAADFGVFLGHSWLPCPDFWQDAQRCSYLQEAAVQVPRLNRRQTSSCWWYGRNLAELRFAHEPLAGGGALSMDAKAHSCEPWSVAWHRKHGRG